MDVSVTVYTTEYCPYCVRAKKLLTQRGIPFREIVVAEDDEALWNELHRRSGMQTVPQIYRGDRLIGGYSDLAELDAKDQLKSLF